MKAQIAVIFSLVTASLGIFQRRAGATQMPTPFKALQAIASRYLGLQTKALVIANGEGRC